MPQAINLQFDGRLTNIAVQYQNPEYIGDLVIPPTSVPKITGKYKVYDKDERFTVPDTKVGRKGLPGEVEWKVTEGTFTCLDHALEEFVGTDEIDNAEAPIQPLSDATEFVTNLLMMAREKRIADAVFLAANYATANKNDEAGNWATLSYDVMTRLEAGIDACFMPPNVMAMGIETWRKVSRNATVLAAVKGTLAPQQIKNGTATAPAVNQKELADYLGLDAVLVGRARINTAVEGQTASYARVWDGTNATKGGAALLRVKKGGGLKDVLSMANFEWKGRETFTYDSSKGARGGKIVRVAETHVIKSIATDVGYLFQDCLVT